MSFYGWISLQRLTAFWIDTLIISLAIGLALMLVDWLIIPGTYPVGVYAPILLCLVAGPYFAHAELGQSRASLGQKLFRLTVEHTQIWRYFLGRLFPKMMLTLLPFLTTASALFSLPNAPKQVQVTSEKIAYENFMAALSLNIFIWLLTSLRFGQKRQSLLDLLANTQVIKQ